MSSDPMNLTTLNATALLREAVRLDIIVRRNPLAVSRFSRERDAIVADLIATGCPANYADYDHPSEV